MSEHVQRDLEFVLAQYEWQGIPQVIPGQSGMNNITTMIQDQSTKAVIRMYNNHSDNSKLQFEHDMLQRLSHEEMAIATPVPITNKAASTITVAPSGKLAAAFHYIEGERPTLTSSNAMVSLAKAAAHLSLSFAGIGMESKPSYSPYYELESNYPALDQAVLSKLLEHEQLIDYKEKLQLIQEERSALEKMKEQLQALPHQWIHGDINGSNSLAVNDEVIAILDFEFVTCDLRAMELAVLLTEFIVPSAEQLEMKLQRMLHAFTEIVPLTEEELQLLPTLIKLRSVDVAMHFIERFKQGLDSASVLRGIIEHTVFVLNDIKQIRIFHR